MYRRSFAQTAPVIQSITPNSGPSSGGTTVVITGTNLDAAAVCLLPCPPRVIFGDIAVDATEKSSTRLTVVTPAHADGTVDVTVAITGRDPVVVADGFTFMAGQEDLYERVLLPVYFKDVVPGAHGTQWRTDLWIHNGGENDVAIAPGLSGCHAVPAGVSQHVHTRPRGAQPDAVLRARQDEPQPDHEKGRTVVRPLRFENR